jgi:hypothetical protein
VLNQRPFAQVSAKREDLSTEEQVSAWFPGSWRSLEDHLTVV